MAIEITKANITVGVVAAVFGGLISLFAAFPQIKPVLAGEVVKAHTEFEHQLEQVSAAQLQLTRTILIQEKIRLMKEIDKLERKPNLSELEKSILVEKKALLEETEAQLEN